jgi:hemerythrin-like domain-containing protein
VQAVHEHHLIEEQFTFPEFEKKLGEGALQHNVDQHAGFLPQFHDLEEYIQAVKDGKKRYNGNEFVEMINSFSDIFVQHLVDVRMFPVCLRPCHEC